MTYFKSSTRFFEFSLIFRIFTLLAVVHDPSYMTLSSQEKHPFLLFSYFRAHPTTLLLKILGGGANACAVPHLKLWGDRRPQSSLGFRPCILAISIAPLEVRYYSEAILSNLKTYNSG